MKLTDSQEQFIKDNKKDIQSIFEVWLDGLKDQLVDEEDNDKSAILRKFIQEFKAFSSTMKFINKEEEVNKEDSL